MSTPAKDIIYIDVDDEITAIIDKVHASKSKILALVLPKRATTLQSVVNMKLLKRSADEQAKHVVLITTETGLLPLAANVGLYVAKNLQSKPEIPEVPIASIAAPDDDDEESISMADGATTADSSLASRNPLNRQATVGELSRGSMPPSMRDEDSVELDNTSPRVFGPASSGAKAKSPKNKKLSVPNFDKFRLWIILGVVALVALILLWILCFKILPKADILVKTDSTAVSTNLDLTLNTNLDSLNAEAGVVPAEMQQTKKTLTQQAAATGQKNVGQKAAGNVTMSAKKCGSVGNVDPVPAGTAVSASGLTFITQKATTFSIDDINGDCLTFTADSDTSVVSQEAGAKYNISPTTFAVAGRSDVSAKSSNAMGGGTDEVKKIVQQSDIDGAKQKMEAQDAATVKQQLQSQINNMGLYAISATFNTSSSDVTSNVSAGAEAENVTVTQVVTYTMLGVKQEHLKALIGDAVKDKIDQSKQSIIDYGLGKAVFTTPNPESGLVKMQATAVAGPDLKIADLKKQVAGTKTGDAKKLIKDNPGVTDVTVQYSPFWVTKIPSDQSKVTITIDEPQVKTNAN